MNNNNNNNNMTQWQWHLYEKDEVYMQIKFTPL